LSAGFLLGALGALWACSDSPGDPEAGFDLDSCLQMARTSDCAEIRNRLFQIDREMVFWDRAGDCPDNSHAGLLLSGCPDSVLCFLRDSIAGPQEGCPDESYREMFDTIKDNLDEPDLGLGPDHEVEEISL
jgi:hypothetical protein